jgi:hypothetical protein
MCAASEISGGFNEEVDNAKPRIENFVSASEFSRLLVSHRRMTRVDRRHEMLKGVLDLDSGEIFFTDARRLLDRRR